MGFMSLQKLNYLFTGDPVKGRTDRSENVSMWLGTEEGVVDQME